MIEEKRTVKKAFNFLAIILILYTFVFDELVFLLNRIIIMISQTINPNVDMDVVFEYIFYGGIPLIAAALISVLVCYLISRQRPSFKVNKKIGFKKIIAFFLVMQAMQLLCSIALSPIVDLISMFGGSTEQAAEAASAPSVFFSSLLYSIIIAPLAEELMLRGLVLRKIEPYGKGFAILISALMFGLIHYNIVQLPITFLMGILFGYVAVEYSLGAAIVLHMMNNTFVEISGNLIYASDIFGYIDAIFVYVSIIFTIIYFVKNKDNIFEYIEANKPDGNVVKTFFTSPLILIVIIFFIIMTLGSITPINI